MQCDPKAVWWATSVVDAHGNRSIAAAAKFPSVIRVAFEAF